MIAVYNTFLIKKVRLYMRSNFEQGVVLDLMNAEEIGKELLSILDGNLFSITVIDVLHRADQPRIAEHRRLTDVVGPRRKKVFTTVDRQSKYAHVGLITNVEAWSISNTDKAKVTINDHIVKIEQEVGGKPVIWNITPE